MENKFSLKEIVRFAVEIEKEGKEFYKELADRSVEENTKSLFSFLSHEEEKHQIQFENIMDALGKDENQYFYTSENEYAAHLRSFIEKAVFNKDEVDNTIAKMGIGNEAIDFALSKEKDSIDYYEGLKKITPKEYSVIIEMIISEENLHVIKLLEIKK